MTKAIPNTKTNATTTARIILGQCVENYGKLSKLFTDNGLQFVSKFFVVVCSTPGVTNITTTEYQKSLTAKRNVPTVPLY